MTREEAIKIVRENMHLSYDKGNIFEALKTLVPELAEWSEGERIRNSLLEFLDDVWHMGKDANFDRWGKADCADWIAYLEKRKEENHDGKKWLTPEQLHRIEQLRYEAGFDAGVRSEVKKRKEREPILFSEPYNPDDYEVVMEGNATGLKKKERKPADKELSMEKAIRWLDDTFYFSDNSSGRGRDCEITTHDFDSLEEMYDSFRKAVTVDSEPHWKPSEEQMEALKKAAEHSFYAGEGATLRILYNDLQKRYGTC